MANLNYSSNEKIEMDHFDLVSSDYNDNYGYGDSFTKYKISKKSKIVLDSLSRFGLKEIKTAVEIGCGTGIYTKIIANKLKRTKIYAFDISKNIIKFAKKYVLGQKNVVFVNRSFYNSGMGENSVDLIFGFYILHHLDSAKYVREVYRILRSGGLAVFYEPNILNPIVFAIKSIPFVKKFVGDSPNEWAINPLTVKDVFKKFEICEVSTTEFIPPLRSISFSVLKNIDKITNNFSKIPVLKLLGGSVKIVVRKK